MSIYLGVRSMKICTACGKDYLGTPTQKWCDFCGTGERKKAQAVYRQQRKMGRAKNEQDSSKA